MLILGSKFQINNIHAKVNLLGFSPRIIVAGGGEGQLNEVGVAYGQVGLIWVQPSKICDLDMQQSNCHCTFHNEGWFTLRHDS